MKRILAFDIGIKNLAWACADISGSVKVKGWANENLITCTNAEEDAENNKCESCKKKGNYTLAGSTKSYCVKHCPPLTPALRDSKAVPLKKIPNFAELKLIATSLGPAKADMKNKQAVLQFLEKRFCFPKVAKAVKKVDLETIHDGIIKVINTNKALFSNCTEILLENQPAFKNPVMKSVQMMLFATIRCILQGNFNVRLVHAGKKTSGATKGDTGYSERKASSEMRIEKGLKEKNILLECDKSVSWFSEQSKKSDLADCLCMVMDAAANS